MPPEPPPADGPRLPDELLLNQGLAQLHLGQLPQARASLERLLSQNPAHFDAHYLLATVLGQQGEMEAALRAFDQALALRDNHPLAHGNRAALLLHLGRHAEALQAYDQAIALKPDFAAAHFRRGVVLQALGQSEGALQSHARALQLQPALDEARQAWLALKAQLGDQAPQAPESPADPTQAEAGFDARDNQRAAAKYLSQVESLTTPADAGASAEATWQALAERGQALARLQQPAEAAQLFERALAIAPEGTMLPGLLLGALRSSMGWDRLTALQARIEHDLATGIGSVEPITWLLQSDDPASHRQCSRLFGERLLGAAAAVPLLPPTAAGPRIRVAYLSADFAQHAVMTALAEVFELHDRSRFDIHAYAYGKPEGTGMRDRLRAGFERYHEVHALSDAEIARHLREQQIDIAVDLMGYTEGTRLGIFRHRPAPVAVNLIGYPGTLGLDGFDYIVGDATLMPPGSERFYSEQLVRLPGCYLPVDRRRPIALAPPRQALGLPEGGFVFCAFSHPRKISPDVFAVWMRLLRQLPGSVLWLVEDSEATSQRLRGHAERAGVEGERLVFAGRARFDQYLARYTRADLFLDTLPYNALATISDALWAGLPAITCTGQGYVARGATSILRAAGLPELVTTSLADYEALALRLARSPDELAALKERVLAAKTASVLTDTPAYARSLERAYGQMVARSRAGLPPAAFDVPAESAGSA